MRKHRKNRDLFELFRILYEQSHTIKERQERAIQYGNRHQVDGEVIAAVTTSSRLPELKNTNSEKGGNDMCEVFESIFNEGKEEGMRKGVQQGKLEGKQEGLLEGRREGLLEGEAKQIIKIYQKYQADPKDILDELVSELKISFEQANQYMETFGVKGYCVLQ
ncbi:MAG: hypothetical protein J1F22_08230 [Lachnospiraceae bacterium]|nr:hypothetical protein [Lachnospiraceae bacterium]